MVRLIRIDADSWISKFVSGLVNNRVTWKLAPEWARKWNDRLLAKALDRFTHVAGSNAGHYDVAYCIDATGLYAFWKSGIKSAEVINISLEVLDLEFGEHGKTIKKVKQVEKEMLVKQVKHIIIQDKYRADLLSRTVGVSLDKFLYLPNSVEKGEEKQGKSRFFHKKFNLAPETRIVLSAGMIGEAVSSLEIAKIVGSWNPSMPVKVIFHERLAGKLNTPYLNNIRKEGKDNVLLSLQPLPFDELDQLFSSADIGLAIYNEHYGDNFGVIGSASGKLFQYIKQGLPVIVSDLPGLGDMVRDYDMGLIVKSTSEIPGAIETILSDYARFSYNARNAFLDDLNMDIFLENVYAGINS